MRPVRRLMLIALTLLVVTACGSSGSGGSSAGTPLASALSYFPQDTPFVATVDTAANGASAQQMKALQGNDPQLALVKAGLFQELAKLGIDYNADLKPLLGNPVALGIGASQVSAETTPFLAAWQTNSQAALKRLVSDLKGVTRSGTHDGATMYQSGGAAFATDGALVLVSNSAATITAALDRHSSGVGLTAADYDRDTSGLPDNPLVSMVGDLQSALDTPKAAQARKVPWVAALKSYGVAITGSASKVSFAFRLDTTAKTLTGDQLPIADGSDGPGLAGSLPIQAGLRDPGQVYAFIADAERAADPSGYRKLLKNEANEKTQSGVDIDQFARSLTGDLSVTSDGHTTIARLKASAADAATYEKLLASPNLRTTSQSLGQGFYALAEKDGTKLVGGVADGELLLGNGTPAQLRAYASTPASAGSGTGALAYRIALAPLIRRAMTRSQTDALAAMQTNPFETQLLSKLGDLSGSLQATPQALTGSASLPLKRNSGG